MYSLKALSAIARDKFKLIAHFVTNFDTQIGVKTKSFMEPICLCAILISTKQL